ncbi:MAG: hypothetical protein QOE72_1724 [Chloroflexota bacterium]|jgi:uncharacterized protein with NAD-binding domain and iron-sulfur cluster|nr:hypothetical protein [Chloroflexota bacterium]
MTGARATEGRVVILGGGVAGMSAAQELAERGFEVVVLERMDIAGGKARSMPVPRSGTGGRPDLPGEHGFRFFPAFYRHLPDTMRRIPFKRQPGGVLDNLVEATHIEIAQVGRRDVVVPAVFPTSPRDVGLVLRTTLRNLVAGEPGLTTADIAYFTERLLTLLGSCRARREHEFEYQKWWTFSGAVHRSRAYQLFLADGLTRCLVAARAEEISARTAGFTLLQLLFGMAVPWGRTDRLLNGPTNEVWINPWLDHLRRLGVDYRFHTHVEAIHCEGTRIREVVATQDGVTAPVTGDHFISALPVEVMGRLVTEEMTAAEPRLGRLDRLRTRWMTGVMYYLGDDIPLVRGHALYIDTPWALTSISQHQFWDRTYLRSRGNGDVSGILSVDVSDWNTPGEKHRRPARECSEAEIKEEVWHQLARRVPELNDARVVRCFIDSDIRWRKKADHPVNLEPLLINTPGSWDARPKATLRIENLFLASDYVRTHTNLATMEGANEAARRAVNGILEVSGSREERCGVWPLREPDVFAPLRFLDSMRYRRRLPARPAAGIELEEEAADVR